jgi:hypothetical protein
MAGDQEQVIAICSSDFVENLAARDYNPILEAQRFGLGANRSEP